jgi:hypothetical protein
MLVTTREEPAKGVLPRFKALSIPYETTDTIRKARARTSTVKAWVIPRADVVPVTTCVAADCPGLQCTHVIFKARSSTPMSLEEVSEGQVSG